MSSPAAVYIHVYMYTYTYILFRNSTCCCRCFCCCCVRRLCCCCCYAACSLTCVCVALCVCICMCVCLCVCVCVCVMRSGKLLKQQEFCVYVVAHHEARERLVIVAVSVWVRHTRDHLGVAGVDGAHDPELLLAICSWHALLAAPGSNFRVAHAELQPQHGVLKHHVTLPEGAGAASRTQST